MFSNVGEFEVDEDHALTTYWFRLKSELQEKNAEAIISVWRSWLKKSTLCIPHPVIEGVKGYAKFSYMPESGWSNVIFFSDENGENPWFIEQSYSLCDSVILDGLIIPISKEKRVKASFNRRQVNNSVLGCVKKAKAENFLKFNLAETAIIVNHSRPYHFFYDQFSNLRQIVGCASFDIDVAEVNPFFPVECLGIAPKPYIKDKVYFLPLMYVHYRKDVYGREQARRMELSVKKFASADGESKKKRFGLSSLFGFCSHKGTWADKLGSCVRKFSYLNEKNKSDDFNLWFGVTGQKRAWLEQVEACVYIANKLCKKYNHINLYIDGMTAPYGELVECNEDISVFKEIAKRLSGLGTVDVLSLIGKDYLTKLGVIDKCDFFVSNSGTGALVPVCFSKCPGVVHGLIDTFAVERGESGDRVDLIGEVCTPAETRKGKPLAGVSYHLSKRVVCNRMFKSLGMEFSHSLENIDLSNVLHYIRNKDKHADLIRDMAVSFEKAGDIRTAKALMEQAEIERPNGPFINQKLVEYEAILESN